jgi:hypothetical protein
VDVFELPPLALEPPVASPAEPASAEPPPELAPALGIAPVPGADEHAGTPSSNGSEQRAIQRPTNLCAIMRTFSEASRIASGATKLSRSAHVSVHLEFSRPA